MPHVIVLGAGPAGLLGAEWIARRHGLAVTVIGLKVLGGLEPLLIDGRETTVLPVFPHQGQHYPEFCTDVPVLVPSYVGTPGAGDWMAPGTADSYAARARVSYPAESLALAAKQFGQRVITEPLAEVQRKIERHYLGQARPRSHRLGYVDGQSPYVAVLRSIAARFPVVRSRPVAVTENRQVVLDDGRTLAYDVLVNTLPLPLIAELVGGPAATGVAGSASFLLARIAPGAANALVYDVTPGTPVFRVLTPHPDIAVVQLSLTWCEGRRQVWVPELRARVERLLGTRVEELVGEQIRIRLAYPIDPPAGGVSAAIERVCRGRRVINVGRFAEWRYIDLHEIDWEERFQCLRRSR
jgi:hypothetical protein